jgi:exopolyphosphatase/guanosine-5'-triphosphate,3'-diphosphate pyrophosphatase
MTSRLSPSDRRTERRTGAERRLAVVDMGSNTFRLVVFRYRPGGGFRLVDEIRHAVRLSEGADESGLRRDALERAEHTARLYAAFCEASEVDEVVVAATSAARDAANGAQAMRALSADGALDVRVLTAEEEAWYGYLGAVNSTTLGDGHVLDLGGGSVQVTAVRGRALQQAISRPLGAVRMTERYLPGERQSRSDLKPLRRKVLKEMSGVPWLDAVGGRMVGVGGTIRTLARMHQRATDYALDELHGYVLPRAGLEHLIEEMLELPASERSRLPGLKPDRADITLAGATVISSVMEAVGVERIEICAQGLREGIFYERWLAPADPPLIPDVRRNSVLNLVDAYRADVPHAEQVCRTAGLLYAGLVELGLQRDDPRERELLWAAGMLHDVGVMVDYNDHHKHGFYLILNAGLPGFDHAELALVALLARAHRKALPSTAPLEGVLGEDDPDRLDRLAVCLRIAEQLERGRAGGIRDVTLALEEDDAIRIEVTALGDPAIPIWSAGLEAPAVERAFGRPLRVVEAGA